VELLDTFLQSSAPYSALQFVPVLKKMRPLNKTEVKRLLAHPESKHVLINNDLMKVVLIHWRPGEVTDIHGHPKDGCVFKVLHGNVEELRYSTKRKRNLIGKSVYLPGSLAYIDDSLGYHSVRNYSDESAISFHVYTPGK
jgi:predicted metal-dependent enzyme (double-stranded beta helix superfamily)